MLSFAPVGWFWLAPVLLLPFLVSCLVSSRRAATRHGFWYGAGLFLTGTYWLYTSIHVFGQAPLWIAILLMLGLVIIMALYYAAAAALIWRLCGGDARRLLLAGPAAWVAVEWLRGWFLSGFPWMTLGYSQIDSPLAGFAPLAGVYGVSAMLLVSVAAIVTALEAGRKTRHGEVAVALTIAILPWVAGGLLRSADWTQETGTSVRTTIVQGGVSQDRKWLPEQFRPTLELYRASLATAPDSELVVWPEVAIPAAIDRVEGYIEALQSDLRRHGQTLLLGVLERDLQAGQVYNSVLRLDGSTRQIYRKRHLVPFGEFFPVPDFVREWMRLMSLPNNDLTAGAAVQELLDMPSGDKLSVAICYEDAYGAEQLYALPDASILINVSNDAWFGDSIAPHQHLEIARMRALEAGRFVVRATNNGVSAFIGPDGAILESGPQFESFSLTRDVRPRRGLTPYARTGNGPLIVLALVLLGFAAWQQRGENQ